MKRFMKLSVITLVAAILLGSGSLLVYAQEEQFVTQQNTSESTLQEANRLFLEGSQTFNLQLMQQAKDKFTLWLELNSENADKKMVAQVLRSRANVSMVLNELNVAIDDFQKSNQYDPIGEIQLGICFLHKKMSVDSIDLQTCYQKAIDIFSDNQIDKTNSNYLIVRILSGDKTAIAEYKHLIKSTKDPDLLATYELAAKEYLSSAIYQEIYSAN